MPNARPSLSLLVCIALVWYTLSRKEIEMNKRKGRKPKLKVRTSPDFLAESKKKKKKTGCRSLWRAKEFNNPNPLHTAVGERQRRVEDFVTGIYRPPARGCRPITQRVLTLSEHIQVAQHAQTLGLVNLTTSFGGAVICSLTAQGLALARKRCGRDTRRDLVIW